MRKSVKEPTKENILESLRDNTYGRNEDIANFIIVQCAVAEKLEELDQYPFKKREGCHYSAYSDEEQAHKNNGRGILPRFQSAPPHKRVPRPLRDLVVQPEHMPIEHRKYLTYNAVYIGCC